jgi:glycosyltransferase involved in cell wall biosynthesis
LRYLLVTHIPFVRNGNSVVIDRLWAEDLKGLVASVGSVTIAAPELGKGEDLQGWGPATTSLSKSDGFDFLGLPIHRGHTDVTFAWRVRSRLRPAVMNSDLIHSSNLFPPYTPLWCGHDLAVQLNKKTLFVVAEDFYDMLNWEWVRTETNPLQKLRRRRTLNNLDREVRKRVANASLTFLHTPAAAIRYREYAANAVHIRQPVHEKEDVIDVESFQAKCAEVRSNSPLRLIATSRMESLKGIDFIIRAVSILKQRNIPVTAALYGKGSKFEAFKLLAQKLELTGLIDFPGTVAPGPQLRQVISSAHIFLMPHLTTDFGRAFFDAMAGGLPVVAFRSPASQDTLRHRVDGLITPNADAEGLADGIAQFHADREFLVRAAEAARERALLNTKSFWNNLRAQMIQELF